MNHLSVLPAKQHKIQFIVSSQISIPNVSPNLTDAHIASKGLSFLIVLFLLDSRDKFAGILFAWVKLNPPGKLTPINYLYYEDRYKWHRIFIKKIQSHRHTFRANDRNTRSNP